jgi:large subunit ribosomal protein L25
MKDMERIELASTQRTVIKGAAKRLRQKGLVPGILYGHGVENAPLQLEALELSRVLSQAGSSQLIYLRIDDTPSTQPVLVREIQRNVLTGEPLHVDFLAVSMTEKITAQVSITLTGEPEAATRSGGILLQGINAIEIECLPGDLIPSLEVDVSGLELDSAIYVSDLSVPTDVTILSDPQEMVAQVVPERLAMLGEEEEEELIEEEPAEVEVIGKGKAAAEEEE